MTPESEIAVLKEQMKDTREDVRTILTNHLPHLSEDIRSIKVQLSYYSGALAVLAIFLQFVPRLFNL